MQYVCFSTRSFVALPKNNNVKLIVIFLLKHLGEIWGWEPFLVQGQCWGCFSPPLLLTCTRQKLKVVYCVTTTYSWLEGCLLEQILFYFLPCIKNILPREYEKTLFRIVRKKDQFWERSASGFSSILSLLPVWPLSPASAVPRDQPPAFENIKSRKSTPLKNMVPLPDLKGSAGGP